ncbi:MAG: RluA family pseudouridine synthase [Chloroflexi bacterium]|nr:RluA family pseudouridine synthase [Chloroflexota bacterium]
MTEGGRLDAVLAAAYPDLSRARVQRLIANEAVLVNGEPARKSTHVEEGAQVAVTLPETRREVTPTGLSLPVLYEDEPLLAIDKPAGLLVHDAPAEPGAPSVAAWFIERHPDEAAAFDVERPGIVHRLDKHTSGVLLLAKTPAAQTALSAAFEARETGKQYLALCDGIPQRDRAVIDADIARSHADRRRMAVTGNGREAQTEYEVLAAARERSLLLVKPLTGRTHQIRVHLAAIGAPVAGDELYGRGPGPRHLLHAWRLAFPHPGGGELTVTAPLPADMRAAIDDAGFTPQAAPYAEAVDPTRTEETA